jgi:hypothetical protein
VPNGNFLESATAIVRAANGLIFDVNSMKNSRYLRAWLAHRLFTAQEIEMAAGDTNVGSRPCSRDSNTVLLSITGSNCRHPTTAALLQWPTYASFGL